METQTHKCTFILLYLTTTKFPGTCNMNIYIFCLSYLQSVLKFCAAVTHKKNQDWRTDWLMDRQVKKKYTFQLYVWGIISILESIMEISPGSTGTHISITLIVSLSSCACSSNCCFSSSSVWAFSSFSFNLNKGYIITILFFVNLRHNGSQLKVNQQKQHMLILGQNNWW